MQKGFVLLLNSMQSPETTALSSNQTEDEALFLKLALGLVGNTVCKRQEIE